MNDFDSLREDFANAFTAISDYAGTQRRHAELVTAEVERLWADNAELRDELHALANRVETLTRARLTEPAEVAVALVDGSCTSPHCAFSGGGSHHHRPDGSVVFS